MKRLASTASLILLTLGGCGSLAPFETVPPAAPAAPAGESSSTQRVSVCYNRLSAGDEALRAIAAQSCSSKEPLSPPERGFDLDHCPLLMPQRATFTCPAVPEPPR